MSAAAFRYTSTVVSLQKVSKVQVEKLLLFDKRDVKRDV